MVLSEQIIGRIVYAEILRNTLTLNVCVVSVEINYWMFEIGDRYAVAAERAVTVAVDCLEFAEIFFVKNKCLKLVPFVL